MKSNYFARGKLLLTGEYLILDGAKGFAIPCKKGQSMSIESDNNGQQIQWSSFDNNNQNWFNCSFDLSLNIVETSSDEIAKTLQKILKEGFCISENNITACKIETHLDFPKNWGLGSSSTLIHLIAQWLEIPSLELFFKCLTGSGYDVAVAGSEKSIIYTLQKENPSWVFQKVPKILNESFFIHLNEKQKSDVEVKKYQEGSVVTRSDVLKLNLITDNFIKSSTVLELQNSIDEHESLVAKILDQQPIKERLFKDFNGSVKSLGAWGGDFILAIGEDCEEYFSKKGYPTILTFNEMIA